MTEYNAASRASVREAQKAARVADANRLAVVRNIASSQEGRSYLWDALSGSHIFSSTYTESPIRSAFLEGERNAGLRLLGDIMAACPDQFLQMMREAQEKEKESVSKNTHIGDEFETVQEDESEVI